MSHGYRVDRIQHFSHEHQLETRMVWQPYMTCNICGCLRPEKESFDICFICFYSIHQKCAQFPQYINDHPLHDCNRSLTLSTKSFDTNNISRCYYCGERFSEGEYYTYSCDAQQCTDFQMHAACGAVPLPTPITSDLDDAAAAVRFACHQTPMMIANPEGCEANNGILCFACQLPWSSSDDHEAYSCVSKDCENFFHKTCGDRLHRRISHPFHRHTLWLRFTKPQSCDSCHRKDCRPIYFCRESIGNCSFKLCTNCANYSTTVECQSHDHRLSWVEKMADDSCDAIRCDFCQKSYKQLLDSDAVRIPEEVVQTRSLVFRCLEKECCFDLHLLCGPLPVRVEYKYHIHPLNLVNHEMTEEEGYDEYYCDACEKVRDTRFRVYHCSPCKFIAHIHCVLPEIRRMIKGDTRDVELKALGEDRWDSGKESKKQSDDGTEGSTMRDIMESLTEHEKLTLIDIYHPSGLGHKNYYISTHKSLSQLNSNFFNSTGFMENIDGVQQLFNLTWEEHLNFQNEVRYFFPVEGLKLDEKYLRQKVEDVKGYKVPKTVAPILRALLHEYGTLGENSSLSAAMKSVTATLVCVVMDKMCRTKVEDITREDIKHWRFCLDGVQRITGSEIISRYVRLLEGYTVYVFLGNEAMRCERELRKNLAHKIETLEAELKKCKENCRKFDEYASKKSDLMKECISLASEWKGKYFIKNLL